MRANGCNQTDCYSLRDEALKMQCNSIWWQFARKASSSSSCHRSWSGGCLMGGVGFTITVNSNPSRLSISIGARSWKSPCHTIALGGRIRSVHSADAGLSGGWQCTRFVAGGQMWQIGLARKVSPEESRTVYRLQTMSAGVRCFKMMCGLVVGLAMVALGIGRTACSCMVVVRSRTSSHSSMICPSHDWKSLPRFTVRETLQITCPGSDRYQVLNRNDRVLSSLLSRCHMQPEHEELLNDCRLSFVED